MNDSLSDYYKALNRLSRGEPNNVPRGSKINKDTVAMEAGRGRGSIKKTRPVFHPLIEAIEKAAEDQKQPKDVYKIRSEKALSSAEKYRKLWEDAIARELSLIFEIHELKRELDARESNKISPIHTKRSNR